MATALSVEGKNFIPASEAGRAVGYTSDYIAKLARDGKLEATRIGRQWYVTLDSVRSFISKTEEEKKIRGQEIRLERLREQETYRRQTGIRIPERKKTSKPDRRLVALTETLLILVIGLSIGLSGHFMVNTPTAQMAALPQAELNAFERFALFLYELVMPKTEVETNITTLQPTDTEMESMMTDENDEEPRSMIVAPEIHFTREDAASIQDSFSDPVTIISDPENPDTGIITPHFRNGDGEQYRYLMVPVNADSGG